MPGFLLLFGSLLSMITDHHSVQRPSMLDSYFKLTERNTITRNEINAGIVNYLSTLYILIINPAILSHIKHIHYSTAYTATVLSCIIPTFISGLIGNLPFVYTPALGLTVYITYTITHTLDTYTILLSTLLCGLLVLIFALCNLNELLSNCIPQHIKVSTIIGISLLLSLIGLELCGLLHVNKHNHIVITSDVDWTNENLYIVFGTLILACTLMHYKYIGYISVSVIISTMLYWLFIEKPDFNQPYNIVPDIQAYIHNMLHHSDWTALYTYIVTLSLFTVCLVDVAGCLHTLGYEANLNIQSIDHIDNEYIVYFAVSIGCIVASIFGCTPVILAVESSAGIKSQGRTGISALITCALYTMSLFITPIVVNIPIQITSIALIITGATMMYQLANINWQSISICISSFLTIILIPLTQSIALGICIGWLTYCILYVTTGQIYSSNNNGYASDIDMLTDEPEFHIQHTALHRQLTAPTAYRTIKPDQTPLPISIPPAARYGATVDNSSSTTTRNTPESNV